MKKNIKYDIVYADPPWTYKDKSKSHGGGAESHYPCMKIEDICNLEIDSIPISDISNVNSVLLMWTTFPQLEEALKVIKAWGFNYKTLGFVWIKVNDKHYWEDKDIATEVINGRYIYMGMGRYTRSNAEICLLGTKGKSIPRTDAGIKNVVLHKKLSHSEKPDIFRDKIFQLFGDVPRIELFARKKVKGWTVWGNEV